MSAILALAIGAVIIGVSGVSPLHAYRSLLSGAVGSEFAIGNTLTKATPLLLIGLGVSFALKVGFWNLGGDGQASLGAFGATWMAVTIASHVPAPLTIILSLAAAFALGLAWAAIAALLRARRGTNEIITTILLNYIAIGLVSYTLYGPIKAPGSFFPVSRTIAPADRLPVVNAFVPVELGFWIAIALALVVYFLLYWTVLGYELRVVGEGSLAARYAAIGVVSRVVIAVCISGGLAGLAGATVILGVHYQLQDGLFAGVGFTGVAVALLGRLEPLGVVVASIFIGGLTVGGEAMQIATGLSSVVVSAIQGLLILFVIVGAEWNSRLLRLRALSGHRR